MVYQDHWALAKWYAHFAAHLGAEHLYVIAHGHDPEISAICAGANVITVPRDTLAGFDRARAHMLNSIQDGLGVVYDWVIRTDADELIVLDPEQHSDFTSLFAQHPDDTALFALGLNATPSREAVFSGHYSKAWAVKRGTHLLRHGIKSTQAEMPLPHGVYLAHLKFADTTALTAANTHRTAIANGTDKGLPGRAWREAERTAKRFYDKTAKLPEQSWSDAAADAHQQIKASPVKEGMILRAQSITFETRVKLPDWFAY